MSHSRWPRPSRISAVFLIVLSLGLSSLASVAHAQAVAPILDSFSVNGGPSFEVGDTVSVDYAATGVGFPITELRLGYLDACGTNEGFSGGTSPVDYTVPANTWRPGTHTLRSLSVFDAFGNYTSYLRDGSVTYYPKSGAAIHDTHTLDLSGGDLVVGDDPDVGCIAPTLDSFSVNGGPSFEVGTRSRSTTPRPGSGSRSPSCAWATSMPAARTRGSRVGPAPSTTPCRPTPGAPAPTPCGRSASSTRSATTRPTCVTAR